MTNKIVIDVLYFILWIHFRYAKFCYIHIMIHVFTVNNDTYMPSLITFGLAP